MSDDLTALNSLMAERVMGWKLRRNTWYKADPIAGRQEWFLVENWHPTVDLGQAMQCLAQVWDDLDVSWERWHSLIRNGPDDEILHTIKFYSPLWERLLIEQSAPTLELAIVKALAAWLERRETHEQSTVE